MLEKAWCPIGVHILSERIQPPELGAIPWTRNEFRTIVRQLLDALRSSSYAPEVGLWRHLTCNGWNVQLERQHIALQSNDVPDVRKGAEDAARHTIKKLMQEKFKICRRSLEKLTLYGAETAEEQAEKERLLFVFWALDRSLELCG